MRTAFVYRARIAFHTIKLFFLRNGLLEHQQKSTCQPASQPEDQASGGQDTLQPTVLFPNVSLQQG
jgi:hypothetical protein